MSAPGGTLEADEPPEALNHTTDAPIRLRVALKALRWTYGDLAVALGLSPSTTRNWGLGRSPVPEALLAWAERRAAAMRADPPPGR